MKIPYLFFVIFILISCTNAHNGNVTEESNSLYIKEISFKEKEFIVCSFDPDSMELKVVSTFQDGISRIVELGDSLYQNKRQLLFATNGGIFSKGYIPGGLFVNQGIEFNKINTREGSGNFHLMPNGVFYLDQSNQAGVKETHGFIDADLETQMAIQSGPMLVIDDEIHPAFNEGSENTHIRNGVGVDDKGKIVFVISNQRTNFYDFASLFRDELKCKNALYLDGFISEMYIKHLSKEQNVKRKFATIFYLDKPLK